MPQSPTPEKPLAPDREKPLQEEREHSSSSSSSRRWWAIILGAIALLGIIGGVSWWLTRRPSGQQQAPQSQQSRGTPVRVREATTETVVESDRFVGTLESNRSIELQAEAEGNIEEILVEEGMMVEQGEAIARISPTEAEARVESARAALRSARAARESAAEQVNALQAELEQEQAELDLQQSQFRRTSYLLEQGAIPEEELDLIERDLAAARSTLNATQRRLAAARADLQQAQANIEQQQAELNRLQEQLQETTITAPFAGEISEIIVDPGDYVNVGETITMLSSDRNLQLRLPIPLERRYQLELGLPVRIFSPQERFLAEGEISFISPVVEPQSQFILSKARISNGDGQLKLEQFVRARVIWERRPNQVVIPTTALVYQGENRYVFVANTETDPPIAERRSVEVGIVKNGQAEILSGLEPGTPIVVSGKQNLFDEAPISPLPPVEQERGSKATINEASPSRVDETNPSESLSAPTQSNSQTE